MAAAAGHMKKGHTHTQLQWTAATAPEADGNAAPRLELSRQSRIIMNEGAHTYILHGLSGRSFFFKNICTGAHARASEHVEEKGDPLNLDDRKRNTVQHSCSCCGAVGYIFSCMERRPIPPYLPE